MLNIFITKKDRDGRTGRHWGVRAGRAPAQWGYYIKDRFSWRGYYISGAILTIGSIWYLIQDNDHRSIRCRKSIREMVADWAGAGRGITGKWEVEEWYEKNKAKILIHPDSKILVEAVIDLFTGSRDAWTTSTADAAEGWENDDESD